MDITTPNGTVRDFKVEHENRERGTSPPLTEKAIFRPGYCL